ncbi:MAG: hypothetical protein CMF31_03255 [Kordiimonas sp.]|nr:hypothetical protein [Kordiimonas sp.]
MLSRRNRHSNHTNNTWPGFVDALSTLLLVIIFLLSMFVLAQFFLGTALSGRDEALVKLQNQVLELGDLLALEQQANRDLRDNISQLSASLQSANMTREELESRINDLEADIAQAEGRTARMQESRQENESNLRDLEQRYAEASRALGEERELSHRARQQVEQLNSQLTQLRQQLASLQSALEASELRDREQKATIANLSQRLNTALASKVAELHQYRSEFFGRLKTALGNNPNIRVQGDRFIFQSEVLFGSGSADLDQNGKREMAKLAQTLVEISQQIPTDINWILRVDGHTDKLPIKSGRYPSNWELSIARALSVVYFLNSRGVDAHRLAATGFGPYQPLDPADTPDAYQRNRRIELRLTAK